MSDGRLLQDFEVLGDIVSRPHERLMHICSKASGTHYACRHIDTARLNKEQRQMLHTELQIFQQLDGDMVLRYLKVLRDDANQGLCIITELCDDGTLEDLFLRNRQRHTVCSEEQARAIVSQIARIVDTFEARNGGLDVNSIVKALTPKSILMFTTGKVKFKALCSWHTLSSISVTPTTDYMVVYTAPEYFSEGVFTEKSHVWALGCILYEALTGRRCFASESGRNLRQRILVGEYDPLPSVVSEEMQTLVYSMLQLNHKNRPTLLDVRMALKVLSDASKTYHWDTNIVLEAEGQPTPLADAIRERLEAGTVDIVEALRASSSPVAATYIRKETNDVRVPEGLQTAASAVLRQYTTPNATVNSTYGRTAFMRTASVAQQRRQSVEQLPLAEKLQSLDLHGINCRRAVVAGDPIMRALSSRSCNAASQRDIKRTMQGFNWSSRAPSQTSQEALGGGQHASRQSAAGHDMDPEALTLSNLAVTGGSQIPRAAFSGMVGIKQAPKRTGIHLPSQSIRPKSINYQHLIQQNTAPGSSRVSASVSATAAIDSTKVTQSRLNAGTMLNTTNTDMCGNTDMMIAAMQGSTVGISHYLSAQAQMTNYEGKTALMLAAERGHEDAVCSLIEKEGGMQLALPDGRRGKTALMLAVINNHPSAAQYLIDTEAGLQDENGNTALMFAAKNGAMDIIKALMPREAGKANDRGETALMMAAASGKVDCIALLMSVEAGIRTAYGWTALCFAVMGRHIEAVKIIVKCEGGLQSFKQGCNGVTALMLAAETGMLDAAEILVEKELFLRNNIGETALELACKANQTDMATYLRDMEIQLAARGP